MQTYTDKVFKKLFELDGELIIKDSVKPENRAQFIDCVKCFIRIDPSDKFYIEFSSDYTTLRKLYY